MKKKKGFLVIAHGSRKDEANQQVFSLVRKNKGDRFIIVSLHSGILLKLSLMSTIHFNK